MRKVIIACCFLVAAASSWPAIQQPQRPAGFAIILGPRIGVSYVMENPESFTESLHALFPVGDYFPVFTLFGVTMEQRILLGETSSHFAFQEVILIGGLEQSIAIPEAALLIGYRDFSGLEFGLGPILSPAGIGVLVALGWTFSFKGVFVPVDLTVILPNSKRPAAVGLTTGFNFELSSRE